VSNAPDKQTTKKAYSFGIVLLGSLIGGAAVVGVLREQNFGFFTSGEIVHAWGRLSSVLFAIGIFVWGLREMKQASASTGEAAAAVIAGIAVVAGSGYFLHLLIT